MLDGILANVIRAAKEGVQEGTMTIDEYAKALGQIYEKMREFNGCTAEEFYREVEKL